MLVGFGSERTLEEALARLHQSEIPGMEGGIETYTPMPLDGVPTRASPLPLCMFLAGTLGFIAFFLLMTYADVRAYPLDIGGRPRFAWPTFVPIAFELGMLCAMATGFVGYFIVCRMPRLYEPVDECGALTLASRDGWFVSIRSDDPDALIAARTLLGVFEPTSVDEYSV